MGWITSPLKKVLWVSVCGQGPIAVSRDVFEDLVGRFRPLERLRILVPRLKKLFDYSLQFGDAVVRAAFDLAGGQNREPSFDLIQPGRMRRNEVQVKAGLFSSQFFTVLAL